ncbi:hypothetical protein [Saccharopolyspora karakumensis]|uniref:hypothetical protein n=1 Tax=Saccharopolyspora karakumensis TaxID=2530386 RepID=UPI001A9EF778|nr:hypothetical protein [Saccharopolyspora karakumensis]
MTYELIRSAEVADRFREAVRTLTQGSKPLAITGFGTAAYRGVGDEAGQVAYLSELLQIFETEGVDSAFVFLFALPGYPHRRTATPETTWTGRA